MNEQPIHTDANQAPGKKKDNDMVVFSLFFLVPGLVLLFSNEKFWVEIGYILLKGGLFSYTAFVILPYALKRRKEIWGACVCFLQNQFQVKQRLNGGPVGDQTFGNMGNVNITVQHTVEQTGSQALPVAQHTGHQGFSMLQAPFSLLPYNPRKNPSAALTQENATDLIGNALQLINLNIESNPEILAIDSGPTLQTVSFRLPAKVQISKLKQRQEDLANHLGCHSGFDVVNSNFPSSAGFVIPHKERAFVYLRDVIESAQFQEFATKAQLPVVLGLDMLGQPLIVDLAKLPHMLVAGATNSGKSVFVNDVLGSLLLTKGPEELKLLLIDPKMVEFGVYNGFPHLLSPSVTDMRRAGLGLMKVIEEMEKRYDMLSHVGVRNIYEYNRKMRAERKAMLPYIVVVIDEYAELMQVVPDEVENAVQRIGQKARAAGIHLILATQRPSVDVVSGIIKTNMPCRVAFKLVSSHDFRTVMDGSGPTLMGFGDGIIMLPNGSQHRFQSASVSVEDVEAISFLEDLKAYWNQQGCTGQMEWSVEEKADIEMDNAMAVEQKIGATGHSGNPSVGWLPDNEPPFDLEDGLEEVHLQYDSNNPADDEETLYVNAKKVLIERGCISQDILKYELGIPFVTASSLISQMDDEELLDELDRSTLTRPLRKKPLDEKQTDEQLLERMKYYICSTRSARTRDLQLVLGIRKDKVLSLMQQLLEEDFLEAPINNRLGYTIRWTDDEIDRYLSLNIGNEE